MLHDIGFISVYLTSLIFYAAFQKAKCLLKKGTKVYFELRGKEAVMLPEVEDPLEELRQLRKEIHFSEKEIQSMIEESKKIWSTVD